MPRRKPVPRKKTAKNPPIKSEVTYLATAAVGISLLLIIGVYIVSDEPTAIIRVFSGILFGFFGYGAFLLPLGVLTFALCRLVKREFELPAGKVAAVFWLCLSLLHIFVYTHDTGNIFVEVFRAGLDSGGGIFGLIVGGLLRWATGSDIIPVFIIFAAIIILIVAISGRSLVSFVGSGLIKARDFYEETRVEDATYYADMDVVDMPAHSARKKGNFLDINKDDNAPTPQKILLVSEEINESYKQQKSKSPLFKKRTDKNAQVVDYSNAAVVEFPASLAAQEAFLPPEPREAYPEDEYRDNVLPFGDPARDEYAPPAEHSQNSHLPRYDAAGATSFSETLLDEYPEEEPVVLPLDLHVHTDEPVVKGLVEGGEEGEFFTNEAEFDDDVYDGTMPPRHAEQPQAAPSAPSYENFTLPELGFLAKNDKPAISAESRTQVLENSRILEETLRSFKIEARVVEVSVGPTVTRYDLSPGSGVKVASITNLSNDLALSLAAQGLRIEAPVPGKSAIGIEIPNKEPQGVFLREILEDERFVNFPSKLAFAVGKDIAGSPIITDVARMPHLLIAGATGSGKSVCINTLIVSILYKSRPDEVKLLMIDPKVVELSVYNGIPHLLIPVVTDPKKASGALNWAVAEMEKRYTMFAETGCREIKSYNASAAVLGEESLPLIVVIIDELADLMMSGNKSEVEQAICRLAQKARAAGIHLIVATQRPSVDVITGLIKANIPSRLAFAVSSGIDSRTVLDMYGAEKLLGKGDMLFLPMGQSKPLRVQGGFISEGEVEKIVNFLREQAPVEHSIEEIQRITMPGKTVIEGDLDEFFFDAVDFLISKGKGSTSVLQRQFRIGYNRASRLMEDLHARGIVGPEDGVKPRKVTITREEFNELYGGDT
ncbi:MAG: DNA translocase FtsK [Defluviitaleaceae bacterium]|nr:DNA translocase FtsK [Defluviitaleaceae bacterium]